MKILGFDIGVSSIGWAFVEDNKLQDCGVRIFTQAENPKNKESLALPRRNARSTRRRLNRRSARMRAMKHILSNEFGLKYEDYIAEDGVLPKAFKGKLISPYELRYKAINEALSKEELARVILHITKHRGYIAKNSKNTNINEKGKILKALKDNGEKLKNYRSVGEYFYKEFFQNTQGNFKKVRNTTSSYENCVLASDLEEELKLIFKKQNEFGMKLSKKFIDNVINIAFFQRPLKDFSQSVGVCTFFENEKRAPKNSYSAWEFVALSKIVNEFYSIKNNYGIIFNKEVLLEVLNHILKKGNIAYAKLRQIIKLEDGVSFKSLKYDKDNAESKKFVEFKKLSEFNKALGEHSLTREILDEISKDITLIKDESKLKEKLKNYPLTQAQLEALVQLDFKEHINLSFKALNLIVPLMKELKRYDEACLELGLKKKENTIQHKLLPPFCETLYAEEINNPVVLRVIKEYRKVLNALIKKYGLVHKIHIEFAREVGVSKEIRNKIEKEQQENAELNKWAEEQCVKLEIKSSSKNKLKLKLWKEQKEFCAYSGKKITLKDLQDEKALEIDHIYPYSRSFDDSYNNKVLVFIKENQEKGNKTPFEAFGSNKAKWEAIKSASSILPFKKRQKILDEKFIDKVQKDFIARNLNDTRYATTLISKYTKEYLEFLPLQEGENKQSGDKGSKIHVQATNGTLTATLRHFLGFGSKNRKGHLHHGLDAVIIAYSTSSMIQAFSQFKKEQELLKLKTLANKIDKEQYKIKQKFFDPFEKGFRDEILSKVNAIFVSKPPRKKTRGALHEETFCAKEKFLKLYGGEEGLKKALEYGKVRKIGENKYVSNGDMIRVDIFKHKKSNKFYGVPIYTMDFALGVLPNRAVVSGKKDGIIKDWLEMDENFEFCFSLYKDDLLLLKKKGMREAEFVYYVSFNVSSVSIRIAKHDNQSENLSDNQKQLFTKLEKDKVETEGIGIQNLEVFEKYIVSPLGEKFKAQFAPREMIKKK